LEFTLNSKSNTLSSINQNKKEKGNLQDDLSDEIKNLTEKLKNIESKLHLYSSKDDLKSSKNSTTDYLDSGYLMNSSETHNSNPYLLSFNKDNMSSFSTKIRTESPSRSINCKNN